MDQRRHLFIEGYTGNSSTLLSQRMGNDVLIGQSAIDVGQLLTLGGHSFIVVLRQRQFTQ